MKTVNKKLNLKKEQVAKLNETEMNALNGGWWGSGCGCEDEQTGGIFCRLSDDCYVETEGYCQG